MTAPDAEERQAKRRRLAILAILVPYVALGIASAALVGVYATRADQSEIRAVAAQIQAEAAADRAQRAVAETRQSCLDRQQARRDVDEILLSITALLPPTGRERLEALIRARPPVEC